MEVFIKATSLALISAVLCLFVMKRDKEISVVLSLAACCMLLILSVEHLQPVVKFVYQLRDMGGLDRDMLAILLQAVGVGVLSQIMGSVCADAGAGAIGKALQTLATAVMLCISLPAFSGLMDLLNSVLDLL